jgi:outer membrane protein insertion porin family
VFRVFRSGVIRGLFLIPWLASAAAAQQPAAAAFVGRPIASISLSVEGTVTSDPSLADAIQTKAGQPLDMAEVRETITHLYNLGRFENVNVAATATPSGGVALVYDLAPVHIVTSVRFEGELGLSEGTLRQRMTERFGAMPPLSRAGDVAAGLEDLYHERGYLSASVTAGTAIVEHEPHRATAVYVVHAGTRTTIAKSNVVGHPLEPVEKVRERLQIQPGEPYEPGELQRRLTDYATWMRHRGYYQALAHEEQPSFTPDRTNVDTTVNVEPGSLVRVEFEGDPLPKAKLAELVPIEHEGSVDPDILEDSARRIKDFLNSEGYWKADVKPPERRVNDGQLVLVFHITRGVQYRVAPGGIDVSGNTSVPIEEIRPLLKMSPGDLFVESRVGAIEGAIRALYLRRGFAKVELASQTNEAGAGLAKPAIVIKEGARYVVNEVKIAGNRGLPTEALMTKVTMKPGMPYYGPDVARSRDAILGEYLNAGYASAKVTSNPLVDDETGAVQLTFDVGEGPQTIVEHIFVTGNIRTRREVVARELQFSEGKPLGLDALTETRRRLAALGLFRRIQIASVAHGDPSRSDVVVTVEEAPRTTIGYGGGVEVDRIRRSDESGTAVERYEFAPRGFFEVGRRNLAGTNRSVDLYTRLSLRPSNDPESTNPFGFSEYRIVGTYREPRALRNYGDLTGTAALEQGVRTGFNFARKGLNAELTHRLSPTIRGSVRYSFGTTRVFDLDPSLLNVDQTQIDRIFPQVRLSSFSAAASRDTRDDVPDPQTGSFLSADGTTAARAFGSEVGYAKAFLQSFVYRNLGRPRLLFAGGARLGLARGFPRPAEITDANGNLLTVIVRDLPASERFFAGGGTTVRGYAVDTVGAPDTITPTGFPIGGDATIILNAELRAPVSSHLSGVLFLDGGNVFRRTADISLTDLLGSVGAGIRVKTPAGPLRFDFGYKLDRRIIGGKLESPYAVHFSIGQAF